MLKELEGEWAVGGGWEEQREKKMLNRSKYIKFSVENDVLGDSLDLLVKNKL